MRIEEKLAISERSGYLSLIDEGLFLRIYNQSAYIVNALQKQKLVLSCNVIKKLDNRQIVYCGFPKSSLAQRVSNAEKTKWGFEVKGDFDLTDYSNWFQWAFSSAWQRLVKQKEAKLQNLAYVPNSASSAQVQAQAQPQILVQPQAQAEPVLALVNNMAQNNQQCCLSDKQVAFIKSWQRGLYPTEVEEGFMESLKQQLMLMM